MKIEKAQELLLAEARTRMGYLAVQTPIVKKAENLRDISRLLQAIAICKLIGEASVAGFREFLVRSGQARRYYLRKSREEGNTTDRFLGLSRAESIFDSVVAGDIHLARDITALSIDHWNADWEYEDDFCYFLFVHRVVAIPEFLRSDEAAQLLEQFRKALEGQPSSRLAICVALRDSNTAEFYSAFEKLLQQYADRHDEKRATITEYSSQADFWPRSFASIEGLAWLKIATAFGMPPVDRYQFCPENALGPFPDLVVPDLFESLDQALRTG